MFDCRSDRLREEYRCVLAKRLESIGRAHKYEQSIVAKVWRLAGFQAALAVIDGWEGVRA